MDTILNGVKDSWKRLFAHKDVKPHLDYCLLNLKNYKSELLSPSVDHIFEAFKYFEIIDLKVIIVGQDPYTSGATGLSFAVNKSPELAKKVSSLKNIYDCLEVSGYKNSDLREWPKQGILMINSMLTTLTTSDSKSQKHTFWLDFTKVVIKKLYTYHKRTTNREIPIVCWGEFASKQCSEVPTLKWGHPSAASTKNNDRENANHFRFCPHFTMVNEILISQNQTPIIWGKRYKLKNVEEVENFGIDKKMLEELTDVDEIKEAVKSEIKESESESTDVKPENKLNKINEINYIVFTDGGCNGNGKKNAIASYAYYFPKTFNSIENKLSYQGSGLVPNDETPTNNRGEMLAIIKAFEKIISDLETMDKLNVKNLPDNTPANINVHLISDSTYCTNTVDEWIYKWYKADSNFNGRKNPDMLKTLYAQLMKFKKENVNLKVEHTRSHQKAPSGGRELEVHNGNSIVDSLCSKMLIG